MAMQVAMAWQVAAPPAECLLLYLSQPAELAAQDEAAAEEPLILGQEAEEQVRQAAMAAIVPVAFQAQVECGSRATAQICAVICNHSVSEQTVTVQQLPVLYLINHR